MEKKKERKKPAHWEAPDSGFYNHDLCSEPTDLYSSATKLSIERK